MDEAELQRRRADPSTPSRDYSEMESYYEEVSDFVAGSDVVIRKRTKYLPKFAGEDDNDYLDRLMGAKFTNVFLDILEDMSSRPFVKTVELMDSSKTPELVQIQENIDGAGRHLHVFAGEVFLNSIAYTVDWILVEKDVQNGAMSRLDETIRGSRPYWVRVPAASVLAVKSEYVGADEVFYHVRIKEIALVRDGYLEVEETRILEYNRERTETASGVTFGPATWKRHRWVEDKNAIATLPKEMRGRWEVMESGDVGIGIIPIVPVSSGRRVPGRWMFSQTMKSPIHLQKVLYQNETNLEYTKKLTACPMLVGEGIEPPVRQVTQMIDGRPVHTEETVKIRVGPKTVLFTPPTVNGGSPGTWRYVETNAEALKFLAEECDRLERQLREIGRQPLTNDSGNLTVVTTAFVAQKGNSAVQSWALNLKDGLEQAFKITCMWLKLERVEPEVYVYTDFQVDHQSDESPKFVLEVHKRSVISDEALIAEGKRRGYIASEYDRDKDVPRIEADSVRRQRLSGEAADEPDDNDPPRPTVQ